MLRNSSRVAAVRAGYRKQSSRAQDVEALTFRPSAMHCLHLYLPNIAIANVDLTGAQIIGGLDDQFPFFLEAHALDIYTALSA